MPKDNEEDVIDATEEKAKKIGQDLEIEEQEEPEFDIQEEDDERIAKGADKQETAVERKEREKLSNREKRQLKKQKINKIFSEKDAVIRAQQDRLDAQDRRLAEIDNRLSGINKAEVDKAIADTSAIFAKAQEDSIAAFNEGDGAKHIKALQLMKDADDRFKQLNGLKQNLERAPQQAQQTAQPDRIVSTKAKAWAEKNTWYSAAGVDTDSTVAKAISGALVNEGFDPKSDDFWEELDERLSQYMPDKINAHDDEDEDEEEIVVKPKKRTAPPVSGGANRGDLRGKKTITLPTSYVNTLKANGIWDDIPRRNKIIADRERILREQQQGR